MRVTTLLLLASGLALGAESASPDPLKKDAAALQGAWAIVSVEIEGQCLAMDNLKNSRLVINGNRYSFKLGKTKLEFTFQVDATKRPKTIDLRVAEGPDKGKVFHGIYKLDKGIYTICRTTTPGKDRPMEFATRANSGLMMVVWKEVVRPVVEGTGKAVR